MHCDSEERLPRGDASTDDLTDEASRSDAARSPACQNLRILNPVTPNTPTVSSPRGRSVPRLRSKLFQTPPKLRTVSKTLKTCRTETASPEPRTPKLPSLSSSPRTKPETKLTHSLYPKAAPNKNPNFKPNKCNNKIPKPETQRINSKKPETQKRKRQTP